MSRSESNFEVGSFQMNQKVKSIEEFDCSGDVPIRNALLLSAALLVAGLVWIALAFPSPPGPETNAIDIAMVILPISLAVSAIWPIYFWRCRVRDREGPLYRIHLMSVDVATLVRAQRSPELDERSRELITEFLNENHPGWSFDGLANE